MSHYKAEKWLQFINQAIEAGEYEIMESHLYQCDECLNSYMELMESSINENVIAMPQNFIEDVWTKVEFENNYENQVLSEAQMPSNKLLFLYSIAAVITICLHSIGFFQTFVDTLTDSTQAVNKIPSIAQTMTDYELFQKLNFILKNGG